VCGASLCEFAMPMLTDTHTNDYAAGELRRVKCELRRVKCELRRVKCEYKGCLSRLSLDVLQCDAV